MIWHVIFVGESGSAQSRPALTREAAIDTASRLVREGRTVRRIIGPDRAVMELSEFVGDLEGIIRPGP